MAARHRQPNSALRNLIREAGWTYEAVARAICQVAVEAGDLTARANKSAVAHWVAGTCPSPHTVAYLVEAFSRRMRRPLAASDLGLASGASQENEPSGLPPDPVAAVAALGRADVDRRTFLTSAAYSVTALSFPLEYRREIVERGAVAGTQRTATIGPGEVAAVREVTALFSRADEQLGGRHGRSAVVEYLSTDVAAYCASSFAHDRDRQAMFGAAAELAYLAGWKAHDAGLAALAQRYYLHSFQLAGESDPGAHAGYVMRILAHQALDLGRREYCVELASAALDRVNGHVDAATESLFWLTLARAKAVSGERRPALTALGRAETLLDTGLNDEPPRWASLGGPAEARLANQSAKALSALGDLPAAERQYQRSAACWDRATHPRIHALTLADLAAVQCAQGKAEMACGTWSLALDGMVGVQSARTLAAIDGMRSRLAAFRDRGLAAARLLDARGAAMRRPVRSGPQARTT